MTKKQLKFHEAMKRLDAIVTRLNETDLELEEAMVLFTEGTQLANQCEAQLKEFETKVDQIMKEKESMNE